MSPHPPAVTIVDNADDDNEETPLVRPGQIRHATTSTTGRSLSLRYSYGSPSLRQRIVAVQQHPKTISMTLRWCTNGVGLLCVFLFSGIVFGWAPFKLMLQREGQYRGLCLADDDDDATPCVEQMVRFNRIFTAAQFFLSFASLPVGFFVDHASKVTHYVVAATLVVSGLLLLAHADYRMATLDDIPTLDNFLIGYTLLALGGGMAMMGAFPASFLLPDYQGGILAGISCLFDASSIVFAVMTPLHEHYPTVWSRAHLLTAYAALAAVLFGILAYCWSILERKNWKLLVAKKNPEDDDDGDGHHDNNESQKFDEAALELLEKEQYDDTDSPDAAHTRRVERQNLHHQPLLQQLTTLDFAVVLTFAAVQMLRCNFYIETVNEVLIDVAATQQAAVKYAQIFSFVLPLGVLFVPMIDGTVKAWGVVNTLHATNALGALFGVLLLIPSLAAQALNFFVFTGFRAFLYATLNTYIALTFGVTTMGRVIGSAFTTAAVVSLLQYPAATLAEDFYNGDFTVVNSLFLAAGILLPGGLAFYYDRVLQWAYKQEQYEDVEDVADAEKESLTASNSDKGTNSRRSNKFWIFGTTTFLLLLTHPCATTPCSAWQLTPAATTTTSRRRWLSRVIEAVVIVDTTTPFPAACASGSDTAFGSGGGIFSVKEPELTPATPERPQINLPTAASENQPFVQGLIHWKNPRQERPAPDTVILITVRRLTDPDAVIFAAKVPLATQPLPLQFQFPEPTTLLPASSASLSTEDLLVQADVCSPDDIVPSTKQCQSVLWSGSGIAKALTFEAPTAANESLSSKVRLRAGVSIGLAPVVATSN